MRSDVLPKASRVRCIRLNHVDSHVFGVVADKELEAHCSPIGSTLRVHVSRVRADRFIDALNIGARKVQFEIGTSVSTLQPLL
jgi:hypothetical protein